MSGIEARVADHYTVERIVEQILAALAQTGIDTARLTVEDLEPVDEFHIGAAAATDALLSQLAIGAGERVLDIGSGIGGPARFVARRTGAHVTGVDLTESYVAAATHLSALTGMEGLTRFVHASAMAMPFEADAFDHATILHVGMNIADKEALMAEAARVLKPGGTVAVYDVMRLRSDDLAFPLPWASVPETSFVATPDDYRSAADRAGFTRVAERPRGTFAIDFFRMMRERAEAAAAAGRTPPPGIGLLMGPDARTKMGNLAAALQAGTLAPVEMIFRLA